MVRSTFENSKYGKVDQLEDQSIQKKFDTREAWSGGYHTKFRRYRDWRIYWF